VDKAARNRGEGTSDPLFERLLVPTDGSQTAVEAGRLAFRVAEAHGASVTLLHVLDPVVLDESVRVSDRSRDEVRDRMEREGRAYLAQLEAIAQDRDLEVSTVMREGDPYREIVDLADEIGADLIVMGHSGRRGPRRKIAGSVAERVIRFANCPVLVSRGPS
jgi:nucleotide-binding universal stress UspA family protein